MSGAMRGRELPVETVERFMAHAPIDLELLARTLGLDVERTRFNDPEVAGRIERTGQGYRIALNAADGPRRQRFTLAHEIAHYVLHRDLIGDGVTDRGLYRSRLGGIVERQANRYAANILMPALLVREAWRQYGTPGRVATRFEVSDEAARIRLRELGLIGSGEAAPDRPPAEGGRLPPSDPVPEARSGGSSPPAPFPLIPKPVMPPSRITPASPLPAETPHPAATGRHPAGSAAGPLPI